MALDLLMDENSDILLMEVNTFPWMGWEIHWSRLYMEKLVRRDTQWSPSLFE